MPSSPRKILIFSPHPDDDCIGMGATIFKLARNKNRIKIIYMSSGWKGVKGDLPVKLKKEIRRREAIESCRILGISKSSIKFLDLPFYEKNRISSKDVILVEAEIKKFRPDVIFACEKENDPHQTHRKSLEILHKSLKKSGFSGIIIFYRVWKEFKPSEIDLFFAFGEKLMQKKLKAIKAHQSQKTLLFTKKGIRSFGVREEKANKKFALVLKKKGLLKGKNYLFAEVFKKGPAYPK